MQPTAAASREIPWNYTSAEDGQVVRLVLGEPVWQALERLKAKRVTGRSARLLLRLIGDLFILRRNPYLYQDLIDSPERLVAFFTAAAGDLKIIREGAGGEADVTLVVDAVAAAITALRREITDAPDRQARLRAELGAVIGAANVRFDPFTLVAHATDATDWRLHLPVAVLTPEHESQVAPLLAACARLGLATIPRGGGTGLTGGAVPLVAGCAILNTERLHRIRAIRQAEFAGGRRGAVMEVEAGVVTEAAMHAAAKQGLVFATDPTSAWASTIGGNIAENAGGKTAVLWGTAVDNLLSWRLALSGGGELTVRRQDHPLRRILPDETARFTVEGPGDLRQVIELPASELRRPGLGKDITNKALRGVPGLQKEGTDGVITSAEFVLHPAYPLKRTFCLEFFGAGMDEAGAVIVALSQELPDRGEEALQALEHFDEQYVRAIGYRTKAARAEAPKAVLLIDLVAHDAVQLERGSARLKALVAGYPATCLFTARDEAEGHRFWADRKKMGAIARRTNAFKLNEDVVLPLPVLAEFFRRVEACNRAEERVVQAEFAAAAGAAVAEELADDEANAERAAAAAALVADTQARLAAGADAGEGALSGRLAAALKDLCAGWEALHRRLDALHAAWRGRRVVVATHMHAGDGNVHVNIPVFSNDRWMMRRASAAADAMMELAVELGGVVSGEHGIGITKYRFLTQDRRDALAVHRDRLDPRRLMNPGKLEAEAVLDLVFTPSFNLLELEARILQHAELESLADKISRCIRCGKCKPDCCVASPAQGLFFHPRNKNLGIGAVVEAILYDVQRNRSTRFAPLRWLGEIADHCTICHKCAKPCPVEIDSGDVTLAQRAILAAHGVANKPIATRMALGYLENRSPLVNAAFRAGVMQCGSACQRAAGAVARAVVPAGSGLWNTYAGGMLAAPLAAPHPGELYDRLPACGEEQALVLYPAETRCAAFYFPGCGSERLFSDVGRAALWLLGRIGAVVVLPPPRLCCGFPHQANAMDAAARIALRDTVILSQIRRMMSHLTFDGVVVTCGTCRDALDHLGAPGIFAAPLADVAAFARGRGLAVPGGGSALYHAPCHDSLGGGAQRLLADCGIATTAVPHCCSEAGTLALSRPRIAGAMRTRKREALAAAEPAPGTTVLTNCPSCLQGLHRNATATGTMPRHITMELAERAGGAGWREQLSGMFTRIEVVSF